MDTKSTEIELKNVSKKMKENELMISKIWITK
jgi:hypothetical protein